MPEGQPEIDLRKIYAEPTEASDNVLRLLAHSVKERQEEGPGDKYFRPNKIGFGTSLLDSGPTLSDLIDEENSSDLGEEKRRVGFLQALEKPKRDVRSWLVAFWREPAVMFLFDHQKDFLVDDEARKLGAVSMDLVKIVRRVNDKFKEIMCKMGDGNTEEPFSLIANKDGWSVKVRVDKEVFAKMKQALVASTEFTDREKKDIIELIDDCLRRE